MSATSACTGAEGLRLVRLGGAGFGVRVVGLSGSAAASLDPSVKADGELLACLAAGLRDHQLLLFSNPGEGARKMRPAQLRDLYTKIHHAAGMSTTLPVKPSLPHVNTEDLRGRSFSGFPETNVLGCVEGLADWHGLSGYLRPSAWWERTSAQFHHDGGFSSTSPPPPALVAMYCEERPLLGGSTLKWGTGETLAFAAGSTLFYSTRLAAVKAPASVVERAKRMVCCYRRGFGQVVEGEYPCMSRTWLTPTTSSRPPANTPGASSAAAARSIADTAEFKSLENLAFDGAGGATGLGAAAHLYSIDTDACSPPRPKKRKAGAATGGGGGSGALFHHALVQTDEAGREYVMVHAVCLDHLHESGHGALTWGESMAFVEALLAPAAKPPNMLAVAWEPGDVAVWDNRSTQHSVTPTHRNGADDGYAALKQRRLMTRTAMQPSWLPSTLPM